eukprot:scaffold8240_cov133-Cylindrotheca_fusiformis.AAC.7
MAEQIPILVVFGRAGAGKTTIANAAIQALNDRRMTDGLVVHGIDLDVCIPQWMRDNFANGMYPTLEQRRPFSLDCVAHVRNELERISSLGGKNAVIVTFSFGNTDTRAIFRSHFPRAVWALIDTSEEEATSRVNSRKGHFYKVDRINARQKCRDVDDSDWDFAPVTYEHRVLDGNQPVDVNAAMIAKMILENAV